MGKQNKVRVFHPDYRFKLKSKIVENGYRTIAEFCKNAGINQVTMGEIIGGWRVPGPTACQKIAATLNITADELREILS